jgi:hypothetical protein
MRKAGEDMAREELDNWFKDRGLVPLGPNEEPKPVEWMCKDVFTFECSSLFAGKAKAGKSCMAQSVAIGLASGKGAVKSLNGGWIFDSNSKRIKTLYIDTENSRSLALRRLSILAKDIGENLSELISSGYLTVLTLEGSHAAPFIKTQNREGIKDDVELATRFGEILKLNGYRFIVCDVMSHTYQEEDSDRDELSQGFIRDFFKIINALKSTTGANVLLVHHHKKGEGTGSEQASGSSQMLRTPETIISLSRVPEDLNPEKDLYTLHLSGREIRERIIWLKAIQASDYATRVFIEVPEPVKEKKAKGAPATADKIASEILEGVLLKAPELRGREITPAEWVIMVNRVNALESEWQRSDETLKDYLRLVLTKAGLVEKLNTGIYRIL